jgi:S-adenosylmethionine decarboxylase proenzyme
MQHLICQILGPVQDEKRVWNVLLKACRAADALVVGMQKHSFHPQGFTGVVLLGESHATIHTWPEKHLAAVDFFSCSEYPKFSEFTGVFSRNGFEVVDKGVIDRKLISG